LVISDVDVKCSVDGWPAAMTKSCGDGTLFITTLGPRGLMKPRPPIVIPKTPPKTKPKVTPKIAPQNRTAFVPTDIMLGVVDEFFRMPEGDLLPSAAIEPQVREYIGYSTLSPWFVCGALLALSIGVVVIGIRLMRSGRLEHLGWIGSALAIGVSLFLIAAGKINRPSVVATLASVQFVQAIRGTDDLRGEGLMSIYNPEGSDDLIKATHGGRMTFDTAGSEPGSRRMVTTDLGAYHWDDLRQPAGIRSISVDYSEGEPNRLAAYATFDSEGVSGTYSGIVPPGADAILATRDGRLGAALNGDGTFVARGDDVFENGQYLSAGLLSDEQDRRRRTLTEILGNPRRLDYPAAPQLMFWSRPWDNGFRFGDGLENQGSTLFAVPLVIERPVTGTEIMIPSPFLGYVNRKGPDGSQPSAMWDAAKKQWQERSSPGSAWLGFQIPRWLLPIVPRRAQIDLRVTGPIGRIEFLGIRQGNAVSLQSISDPVGAFSVDLVDSDALTIDDDGRLVLGLNAGVSEQSGQPAGAAPGNGGSVPAMNQNVKGNYWRIESLALRLWATTTEPTVKD
jgi:hypothetical protein